MRSKVLIATILLAGVTTVTAMADPMGWFDWYAKGVTQIKGTYKCSKEQPCWLITDGWDDGSANFRVVPMTSDWPEDRLPSRGLITINDRTFKMAQRKEDGKVVRFGSVPVGTFDLSEPMTYTLRAFDSHDVKLVDSRGSW